MASRYREHERASSYIVVKDNVPPERLGRGCDVGRGSESGPLLDFIEDFQR